MSKNIKKMKINKKCIYKSNYQKSQANEFTLLKVNPNQKTDGTKHLYHGTNEFSAITSLREGLIPRMVGIGNFEEFPSNPNMVYLTNCYGPYFAANSSLKNGGRMGIVEIKVSESMKGNFRPDEDFLEQSTRKKFVRDSFEDINQRLKIYERTADFRTKMKELSCLWTDSLNRLGTLGHEGSISSDSITRIALIDVKKLKWIRSYAGRYPIALEHNHEISLRMRNLTRWIFGEKVSITDVFGDINLNAAGRQLLHSRIGIEIITKPHTEEFLNAA